MWAITPRWRLKIRCDIKRFTVVRLRYMFKWRRKLDSLIFVWWCFAWNMHQIKLHAGQNKKAHTHVHNTNTQIATEGGMHPSVIFQTRHVFIPIERKKREVKKKKQWQLNKSVSLWLLCCLFADTRALRINMFALNYLFPPGKQPSCGVWMFTRINIICLPVKLAS